MWRTKLRKYVGNFFVRVFHMHVFIELFHNLKHENNETMKEKVALYFYPTHLGQITVKKHSQPTETRGAFFYPSTPLAFFYPTWL